MLYKLYHNWSEIMVRFPLLLLKMSRCCHIEVLWLTRRGITWVCLISRESSNLCRYPSWMCCTGISLMISLFHWSWILTLSWLRRLSTVMRKSIQRRMSLRLLPSLKRMECKLCQKLIHQLTWDHGGWQQNGSRKIFRSNAVEGQVTMASLICRFLRCLL